MILSILSRFSTRFFVSLPSSNNNNVSNQGVTRVVQNLGDERLSSHNNNFSNQGVTRVVVNIFTKYNNGTTTMTMTKTHHPLVNPMLGLGGVSMVSTTTSITAFIHFQSHFH